MKFRKVFFSIVTSYHLTRKNLSKVSSKLISMSCNGSLLQRTVYKSLPDLCDTEKGNKIISSSRQKSSSSVNLSRDFSTTPVCQNTTKIDLLRLSIFFSQNRSCDDSQESISFQCRTFSCSGTWSF